MSGPSGVSHDKWIEYHEKAADVLANPAVAQTTGFVGGPASAPSEFVAFGHLMLHRREIWESRNKVIAENNPPDSQLVIVCPVAEVGPVVNGATLFGLRVRPEHSATDYRVVWERPV